MKDVIRTEPWALLSRPGGATASESLLMDTELSWEVVRQSLGRLGRVRWPIVVAIMCNLIASVVLNPLSAGLLQVNPVITTQHPPFSSLDLSKSPQEAPSIDNVTFVRSIANFLYNISTSAWTGEDFVARPLGPQGTEMQYGTQLSNIPQIWQGATDVFKLMYQCNPAQVQNVAAYLAGDSYVSIVSQEGCHVELKSNNPPRNFGGLWGILEVW